MKTVLMIFALITSMTATASLLKVEIRVNVDKPACFQGYDIALAQALVGAKEQAQTQCESLNNGSLQLTKSQEITIEVSKDHSLCGGPSVSALYVCTYTK